MVYELFLKERVGSDINVFEWDWCYRSGNLEEVKRNLQVKRGYSGVIFFLSEYVGVVFLVFVYEGYYDESFY